MTFVSSQNRANPLRAPMVVGLGLLALVNLPVFGLGLQSLLSAWATPEYSHGPLIPLISLYLFLRELRLAPATPEGPRVLWPGVCLMTLALVLAVFGNLIRIPDVVTYALILWVGAVMLLTLGWTRGRHHWAPVLHLVFMLPLPQFLYWKLTIWLQLVSSEIGVWVIGLAGIPVYLEGNIIDLGVYKLQVAEACSGLRYLFPILSFSYLFAILYRGPVWHKAVLLLMAAPLTVMMNAFRIGMIGVLVDSYGISHAEGFLHFFEGWVIFGACIGLLFALAMGLQRLTPAPLPLAQAVDLDITGYGRQTGALLRGVAPLGLGLAGLLTMAVALAVMLTPAPPRIEVVRDSFALFPRQIDGWQGMPQPLDPATEAVLGADDYISASYSQPGAVGAVHVFAAWYAKQTEGSGIHSPEVCLPVGGWEVSEITRKSLSFPGTVQGDFSVNRAVIQKGLSRQVVYYWFEQRGKRMTNDYAVKVDVVWDSLTRGRSDGALVRFVTAIEQGESEDMAEARMQQAMAAILPQLPRFIPE